MTASIRSMADFVPIWRARHEELGLTHLQVDALSGLPDGYFGKVMCGMKGPGPKAVELINGALALQFVPAVDERQESAIGKRWSKRKRPLKDALSIQSKIQDKPTNIEELMKLAIKSRMREIGMKGNKSPKRRQQAMARRARQRKAAHAARMRWSKGK